MEEVKTASTCSNNNSSNVTIKKKKEDKQRRRDHKAIENITKELENIADSEKVKFLLKKYCELYDEFRLTQVTVAHDKKQIAILLRERDQLRNEHGKLVLIKARMENLCRELQKQNKQIKEENIVKIREEEERHKEVALQFQNTLSEVSNMVKENSEKNIKLRNDNIDMANRIQSLSELFNERKEQLMNVEKQLELERQLSEATLTKAELELKAERKMWNKEREMLANNLKTSEENCAKLQGNIKLLEESLKIYSGNYKEFESTVSRSSEVFNNCKSEMQKMSKQIATVEKENKMLKQRWQKNAQCVIELTTTKQTQDYKIDNLERKLEQLQKLCRQLQTDRSSYIKLLKENGIEPVSQKCPEKLETSPRKTKKEIELEHLKNNLKVLQEHFSSIQASKSAENEDETAQIETVEKEVNDMDLNCEENCTEVKKDTENVTLDNKESIDQNDSDKVNFDNSLGTNNTNEKSNEKEETS